MKLFIDCEWNSFGGDLISMALCAEDGAEFYEVVGCENPTPWVAEHVMPVLDKSSITKDEFQERLRVFLSDYSVVTIIADWPEDIAMFCKWLITGPGARINTPILNFSIFRIDAESERPHNALWDARGILKHYNDKV